ncbi:probable cytochrome P450 304a1 isoform X2 [Amyelois transitella]|uniref:probable cytochrome P450 304a1 isoform X2 n=1 Tax=Amyelois transitella TaxID=680683 RepID=UPI0029906B67|nr:probable cytochrome P450 304a1 isoform X2 [Amyelois transitella]
MIGALIFFSVSVYFLVIFYKNAFKKLPNFPPGLFFTDGFFWHVQRRFSLRYMRDYGFGRRDETLEQVVESEIKEIFDIRLNGPKNDAEKDMVKGDLVYMPHFLATPFINGILHVVSRMTLPREKYGYVWELAKGTLLFQRSSNDLGGALTFTPWLKDVMPNYSGYNDLKKGHQYLLDFFTNLVKEIMSTFDSSHPRHFLDEYIRQMKKEQNEKRSTYSVEQLILTCVDYMFPAATAPQAVLAMLLERLVMQPELQDRLHEEVDRVVGSGRLPNLDDKIKMPFTEACIREQMRMDTLVPLGVPHRATEPTTFHGYNIPEGTMFTANYPMLHKDEVIWGDPEVFRPDRFIVDGKLDVSKDKSLPFGAGRRLCAGETYARQTMFQVFAALVQNFRVERAPGSAPMPAPRMQGIITTIPDYWIKLTPRH